MNGESDCTKNTLTNTERINMRESGVNMRGGDCCEGKAAYTRR